MVLPTPGMYPTDQASFRVKCASDVHLASICASLNHEPAGHDRLSAGTQDDPSVDITTMKVVKPMRKSSTAFIPALETFEAADVCTPSEGYIGIGLWVPLDFRHWFVPMITGHML